MRRIRTAAFESRLFVVPEDEANRSLRLHAWTVQDAREFHYDRRSGSVIVCSFAVADAVHVCRHDVHLFRMRRSDLRAVDLFAWTIRSGPGVEFTESKIRLRVGIVVDAGSSADAADASAAGAGPLAAT